MPKRNPNQPFYKLTDFPIKTYSISHNIFMVEGQWRQCIDGKPLSLGSIILASDSNRLIDDGQISNSDGSPSWVTVNLGVCTNLMHIRQSKPRLFLQFPDSALFVVSFVSMKPSGNAHAPLKGGFPRWISSTLGSASLVITIQSAVTAGLGYL